MCIRDRPNTLILENAKRLALEAKELVIRIPVIPTFNDTIEEIREIAEFAASLPNVKKLHLLPYHRLGQDKYSGLGRPYLLDGYAPFTERDLKPLLLEAEKTGLCCQIGG